MNVYMVTVMSLTFVLNDAVPRSLPRAHLKTMWCLTFFIAFMTMLKMLAIADTSIMWPKMDKWGRFRRYYSIYSVVSFINAVNPAVIAGSIILLTRITQTSEKSRGLSAAAITVPLEHF